MNSLPERLDEIAQEFFSTWHVWRTNQGWTLGPDDALNKMSPYLVGAWDRLTPNGQDWFKQHAALIIYAVEKHHPKHEVPAHNANLAEVVDIIDSARKSLNANHTKKAAQKLEAARDLAVLCLKDENGDPA